jgi:hypothetical protein
MKKIRDGQTIIGILEGGQLAADFGGEVTDTLAKLKELSGDRPKNKFKGSVTLKVQFEVEGGAVNIDCTIDTKTPKAPRSTSFFWVLDDGSLSTEHPQQTDMFAGPREARHAAE